MLEAEHQAVSDAVSRVTPAYEKPVQANKLRLFDIGARSCKQLTDLHPA